MKRILLVDDEAHVLAALKRVLRPLVAGEAVLELFTDPNQALQRAREYPVDVVLSDYRMPQMNGVEFLRRVRDLQPHAVRMILSASSEFSAILSAVNEVEIYRYLAKPWSADDIVAQVRGALDRAEQTRIDRQLADAMRLRNGEISAAEQERRRLEDLEPGITRVEWGPNGEVLMPDALIDAAIDDPVLAH